MLHCFNKSLSLVQEIYKMRVHASAASFHPKWLSIRLNIDLVTFLWQNYLIVLECAFNDSYGSLGLA
jgi:hypothetical protein